MIKISEAFINLIQSVDLDKVYKLIHDHDKETYPHDNWELGECKNSYSQVVAALLEKSRPETGILPIVVDKTEDYFDKQEYIDVHLLNLEYTGPRPKDNTDYNNNQYEQYFGFGFGYWETIAFAPVFVTEKTKDLSKEEIVKEVLYEITWHGMTEQKQEEFAEELNRRMDSPGKLISLEELEEKWKNL